jgi:ATP-dependent Clp protease protease subunit
MFLYFLHSDLSFTELCIQYRLKKRIKTPFFLLFFVFFTMLIPTVIDKTPTGERVYDIYSRLLEDRIVFVTGEIEANMANTIIAQLLFLEKQDPKSPITMYINSPGGHITAGLAIYDTMQYIKSDVITVCVGLAASMASILLAGGRKGKRYSLPNSEILIHQPLGGMEGQAADMKIAAEHIVRMGQRLYKIIATHTGKDIAQVEKDCDRDYYMTAEDALSYGIIDKIFVR